MKSPGTRSRCQFALSKGSPPPLTHNQRSVRKHPTLRILLYQGKMTRQHPLHFRFPPMLVSMHSNSDDSDGDGASTAASVHEPDPHPAPRDESTSHITIPPGTIPPGTSAITLTPNPKAPASPPSRNIPPTPIDPPRAPPFRPWTTADDQELMSMKQDTKSRPSWKSIGARLHRDPQVCKLRWGILKQSLGLLTTRVEQIQPSTMRRMTNQLPCSVIAGKDVSLPACSLKQFQFLSLLFFVRVSPSPPVVCALFSFSLSLP